MSRGASREECLSEAETIAEYLPFLRRYARALLGSQAAGDAYVTATLDALIADKSLLQATSKSRTVLYRAFTKIWNSLSINQKSEFPESTLLPDQRLASIT